MTTNENKLIEIIEDIVIALINRFLSDRKYHLEKKEHSSHAYFLYDLNRKRIAFVDDLKMEIKDHFKNKIDTDKIGLSFDSSDESLLLGFSKIKGILYPQTS